MRTSSRSPLARRATRPLLSGAFTAAIVSLGLAACGGGNDDADTETEVTILHVNDTHSNVDSRTKELMLTRANGQRLRANVDAGGMPRVKSAIDALSQGAPNVLKLHAGDAVTGTLYFNRAGAVGEADAKMMNTVCFDAFTLGNHEFDKGDSELKNFIDRLHAETCKTPVLSANVQFGTGSALNATRAPGYVQPSVVLTRGGTRIGLVGLTIAGKTKESSSPDAGTTFEDETTAAQRAIDALRAQGVDKIVVMSHIGYTSDRTLIGNLRGVDVVVGGDSHTLLGPAALSTYGVGTPGGAYAETLTNRDGDKTCLVQAWEYSQVVGELRVKFDGQGRVKSCAGMPHVLIGDSDTFAAASGTAALSAEDRTAMRADALASGFLRITAPDTSAQATLQPFKSQVDAYRREVVASSAQELCSRRVPGGPGSADYSRSSASCATLGEVSRRGGDIQQLVAQAFVEVGDQLYGGADISMQSGGGVRVPLPVGDVTAADVNTVLPFGNMLWRLDVLGSEVRSMVEDGLHATFRSGGSTGPYPYTGNLRFDVSASQARGQRAANFEVRNAGTGAWEPLVDGRTYRLFVLSFNATGGDGYEALAAVPAARRRDIGVLDADVFQTWIDSRTERAGGLPVLRKLDDAFYSTKSFTP